MNYTPPGPIGSPRSRKQSQQQIGGSNTDQLLQQLLQQMLRQGGGNRGGVTPKYNATGGGISGGDTIPAMLTPGEFVMSASAVRQHGVGTMRSLNKGQVPGFNRGGMVGGAQYRKEGGIMSGVSGGLSNMMGIDTKEITSTLDSFVGNFSGVLDVLTGAFSPITSAIQGLVSVFGNSDGFKWEHAHTGKVEISGMTNLSPESLQKIEDIISAKAKDKIPDSDFEAGQ
jgi:hypothetical protein